MISVHTDLTFCEGHMPLNSICIGENGTLWIKTEEGIIEKELEIQNHVLLQQGTFYTNYLEFVRYFLIGKTRCC